MEFTFHRWVSVNIKRRLLIGSVILLSVLLFVQTFIVINSNQEQQLQFTTFANIVADAIRNNNLASVQKISLIVLRDLKGQWIAVIDSNQKMLWSFPPQKELKNRFLFKNVEFKIDSTNGPLNLVASIPRISNLPVFLAIVFGMLLFICSLSWSIAGTLKRLSVDFSNELVKLVRSDTKISIYELEQTRLQLNQLRIQEALQAKKLRDEAALVAVGQIVNHIAHDLRSPLQTLLDSLGRIEKKGENDTEISAYADTARQSAGRIKLMAEDLLDYKKARELQLAQVSADNLITESLKDMLVPASQRGVKFFTSVPKQLLLNVDAYKLQRVIANIVLNAIQAIPHEHGVIEIEISPAPLILTIKDNGGGIKPEHLSKIFDCSFTFGKRGGTGLGLAYCYNVLEAHGGTITAESEVDKGTKFIISLPASALISTGDGTEVQLALTEVRPVESPKNKEQGWLLVANEPEAKKLWKESALKHNTSIGIEISALEDMLKTKIDYTSIKGIIIDIATSGSKLANDDVVDIAMLASSKGLKRIRLCSMEQISEKIAKRFEAYGGNIFIKPLDEGAYEKLFQV